MLINMVQGVPLIQITLDGVESIKHQRFTDK